MHPRNQLYFYNDCLVIEEPLQPNQSPTRYIDDQVHSVAIGDQQGPAILEVLPGGRVEDAAAHAGYLVAAGLRTAVTVVDGPVTRDRSGIRQRNADDFSFQITTEIAGNLPAIPYEHRQQIIEQFQRVEAGKQLTPAQMFMIAAVSLAIREARLRWIRSSSAAPRAAQPQPQNEAMSAD